MCSANIRIQPTLVENFGRAHGQGLLHSLVDLYCCKPYSFAFLDRGFFSLLAELWAHGHERPVTSIVWHFTCNVVMWLLGIVVYGLGSPVCWRIYCECGCWFLQEARSMYLSYSCNCSPMASTLWTWVGFFAFSVIELISRVLAFRFGAIDLVWASLLSFDFQFTGKLYLCQFLFTFDYPY